MNYARRINRAREKFGNLLLHPQVNQSWVPNGVFRNKMDMDGVVIRNKARLVAQGYKQDEGTEYDGHFCTSCKN